MTLSDYIAQLGDAKAARTLGITVRAARSYRAKARKPRPDTAVKIVRRSKGAISMQEIYG